VALSEITMKKDPEREATERGGKIQTYSRFPFGKRLSYLT
jgi:hypothetical protein